MSGKVWLARLDLSSSGCCSSILNCKDILTEMDGLVLRGHQIVIPKSLRPEMIKFLHEGHLGIAKSKKRARDSIWWPQMNNQQWHRKMFGDRGGMAAQRWRIFPNILLLLVNETLCDQLLDHKGRSCGKNKSK